MVASLRDANMKTARRGRSPQINTGLLEEPMTQAVAPELAAVVAQAKTKLDAHAVETVQWHFHESTGCPFWLEKKKELKFDPLKEVKCYADIQKFPLFEDEWLRGGPVRRWVPKAFADK